MTNKKKVLELLQNDVLDIELKNCKATDISERITELADRICDTLPKDCTDKHGKWVQITSPEPNAVMSYKCSLCSRKEKSLFNVKLEYPYCHCGAKMDLE